LPNGRTSRSRNLCRGRYALRPQANAGPQERRKERKEQKGETGLVLGLLADCQSRGIERRRDSDKDFERIVLRELEERVSACGPSLMSSRSYPSQKRSFSDAPRVWFKFNHNAQVGIIPNVTPPASGVAVNFPLFCRPDHQDSRHEFFCTSTHLEVLSQPVRYHSAPRIARDPSDENMLAP